MKKLVKMLMLVLTMAAFTIGCGEANSNETTVSSVNAGDKGENAVVVQESDIKTAKSIPYLAAMKSTELTRIMGNGINLGNTMESGGRKALGTRASISAYETGWGMPITTAEMLMGMKKAGFDTIRIPVAWTCAINYEENDYSIRPEFIDRVAEIVNYALDADMFVIVNDHWENDRCYQVTNTINQTFVDTVRATGGNNDHRFLLIAGYNTDISATVDGRYVMPRDNVEGNHLSVA